MSPKHLACALAAILATASAHAQVGMAVTADLGTTGAGVHLVVPMESDLNGRFGINYLKHDTTTHSGGIAYDAQAKLQTFDVLFDWYVLANSRFRLTGGVVYNGNEISGRARPEGDGFYHINGRRYLPSDVGTLDGKVDFQKAAPYIGIGWGNALSPNRRWNFNADLGAFYQGKAHVNLVSRGCTSSPVTCIVLARDVAAEEARLSDELSDHKFFPVLRASVSYSF
jgi:opacity protein-like surface antigen